MATREREPGDAKAARPSQTQDPTAPHATGAIRDPAQARDPLAARAGGGSGADQTSEEPLLLGRPPHARESQRPAIGQSSSQAVPGAFGAHANPVAGEAAPSVGGPAAARALPSGSRATTRPSASDDAAGGVGGTRSASDDGGGGSRGGLPPGVEVLGPGEVLPPRPAPDMTATGAAEDRHPPPPPYDGEERRIAQRHWDRWRAQERRQRPHAYPEWRS